MKRSEGGPRTRAINRKRPHVGKQKKRLRLGTRILGVGKSGKAAPRRGSEVRPAKQGLSAVSRGVLVRRVVKGDFDSITGLSTISAPALGSGAAAARARDLPGNALDVVVTGNHIFQLEPSALDHLGNFSDEEIHQFVVPKRTLARRVAQKEPLTLEETDKAVRLARIDRLASKVFGDSVRASRWLRKPKASLGGQTPLAYLATEAGARAVEEMLNEIDYGIFA